MSAYSPEHTGDMLYKTHRRHGLHHDGEQLAFPTLAWRMKMDLCLGNRLERCGTCSAIDRSSSPADAAHGLVLKFQKRVHLLQSVVQRQLKGAAVRPLADETQFVLQLTIVHL
jgi:hypothetical protein